MSVSSFNDRHGVPSSDVQYTLISSFLLAALNEPSSRIAILNGERIYCHRYGAFQKTFRYGLSTTNLYLLNLLAGKDGDRTSNKKRKSSEDFVGPHTLIHEKETPGNEEYNSDEDMSIEFLYQNLRCQSF
jgi:hypothetical protein